MEWHAAPFGSAHIVRDGIALPDRERDLPGPTLALIVWLRPSDDSRHMEQSLHAVVTEALREWSRAAPRSVLVLANVAASGPDVSGVENAWVGPPALGALVRSSADLRWRVPTVLGIGSSADLLSSTLLSSQTVTYGSGASGWVTTVLSGTRTPTTLSVSRWRTTCLPRRSTSKGPVTRKAPCSRGWCLTFP